ncbi:SGNH/GDSL hydrolase family protein [Rhodococcus sp. IEGM1428]|uniref:SGNH/GDSL hydrolase family protein n=1 Tax=Rhodococcus sp. IEGM1428 TaxID=3392191 RepID=UPI003D135A44
MIVAIAAIAAVAAFLVHQSRPPVDTATTESTITPPRYEWLRVSIMGDDYAYGSGAQPRDKYTEVLARQQCWKINVSAEVGTGFMNRGPGGAPYSDPARLDAVTTGDPELIIVQSSAADPATEQTAEQAAVVFAGLRERAPDALIVVVGPLDPPVIDDGTTESLRSILRVATESAGLTFLDPLDPIAGVWLGQNEYSNDGFAPNSSGHAGIARRLVSDLKQLPDLPRVYACDAVA